MGQSLEVLAGIGVLSLFSRFFTRNRADRSVAFYEFLLIPGPFITYLAFHSVLYWKGLGGSIGLERVIAGVLPLGAILGMEGYHRIHKFLPDPWMKSIILIVCIIQVTRVNFLTYEYPVKLEFGEKMEKQASLWFEKSEFAKKKVFYSDYNACFFLDTQPDVDLLNTTGLQQYYYLSDTKSLPAGCILQWDAHFGANECRTPRDSLLVNPHLKLVNYFRPEESIRTLGGFLYEILFFLVLPDNERVDNYALLDSIAAAKAKVYQHKILSYYDFETFSKGIDSLKISRDTAYSGTHSFRIDKKTEYGPAIVTVWSAISTQMKDVLIKATAFVMPTDLLNSEKAFFVISLQEKNHPYQYEAISLKDFKVKANQWTEISYTVHLQNVRSSNDVVSVYLWNPGKMEIYFDDFTVEALIPNMKHDK